jgi:hypothetical protein
LPFALGSLLENKGKHPATTFALDIQQFATRGQKIDLVRVLVELFGNEGDRLDHMLTSRVNTGSLRSRCCNPYVALLNLADQRLRIEFA